MQQQVGRRHGRTTGPELWGQNAKTPLPDSPKGRTGWATSLSWVGQPPLVTCAFYIARFVPTAGKSKAPHP